MTAVQAVRIRLSGRVQGVGFRWFTRAAAQELGVAGRVRNLPDGRVEVEAVGDAARLDELRRVLREGPPGSRVGTLEEEELVTVPDWDDFRIDR